MQDYMSSGFAPALSNNFAAVPSMNFAPKSSDFNRLAKQPVLPTPSSRGEIIFQQEKKIRNDFLRKSSSTKSMSSMSTKSSAGTRLQQHGQVNTNRKNSALRLKLVASAVAVGLIIFTGQVGCSFLTKHIANQELRQSSSKHPDAATSFTNAIASAASTATASGVTSDACMSRDTLDQAHKVDDSIALSQSATVVASTESTEATEVKDQPSVPGSEVNDLVLNKVATADLVKIGYERLRTSSAQESISILSEAVRRDRNDPTSRRYLGYALLKAGRPSEALTQYAALQKLRGLLPTDRLAMQHAMRTAEAKSVSKEVDNNDTLISKYRAAVLSNPKDFQSKYDLAVACSKLGRTDEAIHECLTGIDQSPSCSEEHQKFYSLYAALLPLRTNRS